MNLVYPNKTQPNPKTILIAPEIHHVSDCGGGMLITGLRYICYSSIRRRLWKCVYFAGERQLL